MIQIPQSTSRVVMLKLFTTGTTTAATGKTVAITVSKAGGAFGSLNAGATNATEVSSGWYKVTLDTTDAGTLGDLVVRGTATGCDDTERLFAVVKATTGGLTALPDAAANANGGLPILSSSGTTLAYTVSTLTTYTGNTVQTGDAYARLGAPAGASVSADVAAVKADAAAVLDDTGTSGVVVASGSKAGYSLAAAGLDSVVVETGLNARQSLSVIAAALTGVLSGAAATTVTIKGAGVATTRVTATVDSDGDRSAVTLNPPA